MSLQESSEHWHRILPASNARAYRVGMGDALNAVYEELSATVDQGGFSKDYIKGLLCSAFTITYLLDQANQEHIEQLRELNRSYLKSLLGQEELWEELDDAVS